MANKFKFTQTRVTNANPPAKRDSKNTIRIEYHDTEQPKLILRVSSSGSKSFAVLKKDKTGKTKRITIGRFPDVSVSEARDKARAILSELSSGIDPIEQKKALKQQSLSLQQLLDSYIENHTLKPSTIKSYQDNSRWGFSDWLNKPASKITEPMVLSRHKKLTTRGKTKTNVAFRVLRAVLNYGHATKAIKSNPVAILSLTRLWHKNNKRNDLIASDQLSEWMQAVNNLTPWPHTIAFKLMLYMGFRITETYSLEWKDVDLHSGLIIQRDTKNGTDHELPIPSALHPLISQLKTEAENGVARGKTKSPFLFPAKSRNGFHGYPKRQIKQINDQISFHFTPHMSRHTFTTIAEAVGIPKTMIDRLTNHTTTNDVTGGYIHTETETLREAINKVSSRIQSKIN